MDKKIAIELIEGLIDSDTIRPILADCELDALNMAIEALRKDTDWIPIKEQLPNTNANQFVTTIEEANSKDTMALLNIRIANFKDGVWWLHGDTSPYEEVIAWMPSPEPYWETK